MKLKGTWGQNSNALWHNYCKGMLTASNFFRISRLKDRTNPDNLISNLMGKWKYYSDSDHLPAPLELGEGNSV